MYDSVVEGGEGEQSRTEQWNYIMCLFLGIEKEGPTWSNSSMFLSVWPVNIWDGLLCKTNSVSVICMYIMIIQKQRKRKKKKKSGFWCLVLKEKTLELLQNLHWFLFLLQLHRNSGEVQVSAGIPICEGKAMNFL